MAIKAYITNIRKVYCHWSEILLRLLLIPIQYICLKILYTLGVGKRKTTDKVVVGFSNLYYNGNPKAVFEYMLKYPEKYEVFWLARNFSTIRKLRREKKKVFFINGFFGIPTFLKTDIWVVAHLGKFNIPPIPHRNYKLIQLWHGIGPKGIRRCREDYDMYDAWCVSSAYSKERQIKLWDAPPDKLYVTGFAEMDLLYSYLNMPRERILRQVGIPYKESKIILLAPTFDVGLWPWGDPYGEFEKLCKFCKKENLILILRLHPYAKVNKRKIRKIVNKYENVFWFDMPKEPDTMKLLAIADILVTDWSSIYTNYLLTKRPIIFLDVKPEYFTRERGKSEIPPEYRIGELVHDTKEFYKILEKVLRYGNRFSAEYERILKIVHGQVDGKASKRVVEVMDSLIGETIS